MKCKVCGKEFQPNHGNQKYCSSECKTIAKNLLDHQYYKHKKQEKIIELVECEYCHETFIPTHGNQKYCSSNCQYHAELEKNAESRMKSYYRNKKRGGDKFWGLGSGGLGCHRHDDPEVELSKIHNEFRRLNLASK